MIEIDGSYGEGGGQILRTSLALSAVTGQPLIIEQIRTHRSQPGLRPQHLAAVKAIAQITQAEVEGAVLHSRELRFTPGRLRSGTYRVELSTAGALTLILQTLSLPLSFAEGTSQVTLTGGTHVRWSPIYPYLEEQWLPAVRALGFRLDNRLESAGFFPRGGGRVSLKVQPKQPLGSIQGTERGSLVNIRGFSGVANLTDEIATRQKHQALKRLYPVCRDSKIKSLRLPAPGKGTFILLNANFDHYGSACYTALGAPGKPAEQVADEAVDQLLAFLETDACLDHYLADQILLPLCLTKGQSTFRTNAVTGHLLTNAHVIQQFLPVSIEVEGEQDSPGLVCVSGVSRS
jgi:RNA 3'-terminal phosphate cyclase (ATP)